MPEEVKKLDAKQVVASVRPLVLSDADMAK